MTPKRCATCGSNCFSMKPIPECHECQNRRQAGEFYSPNVLRGGQWKPNRRGVLVWVPNPGPSAQRRRAKVAPCGTDSGYHRHLRRTKTPPCDACKAAHSEYEWDRQQRARKAVA